MASKIEISINLALVQEDWHGTVIEEYGQAVGRLIGDPEAQAEALDRLSHMPGQQQILRYELEFAETIARQTRHKLIHEKIGQYAHLMGVLSLYESDSLIDESGRAAAAAAISEAMYRREALRLDFAL